MVSCVFPWLLMVSRVFPWVPVFSRGFPGIPVVSREFPIGLVAASAHPRCIFDLRVGESAAAGWCADACSSRQFHNRFAANRNNLPQFITIYNNLP